MSSTKVVQTRATNRQTPSLPWTLILLIVEFIIGPSILPPFVLPSDVFFQPTSTPLHHRNHFPNAIYLDGSDFMHPLLAYWQPSLKLGYSWIIGTAKFYHFKLSDHQQHYDYEISDHAHSEQMRSSNYALGASNNGQLIYLTRDKPSYSTYILRPVENICITSISKNSCWSDKYIVLFSDTHVAAVTSEDSYYKIVIFDVNEHADDESVCHHRISRSRALQKNTLPWQQEKPLCVTDENWSLTVTRKKKRIKDSEDDEKDEVTCLMKRNPDINKRMAYMLDRIFNHKLE